MNVNEFFVRSKEPKCGTAFVLMPFNKEMLPVYEHGIKPLVDSMGLICKRADDLYTSQSILADIWDEIQEAELIIADLTGKNPNVMYELGLCHVLWKKVILLSQGPDDIPFDLKQWRVIFYDFTFAGSARLKEELERAIVAIRQEESIEANLIALPSSPCIQENKKSIENEESANSTEGEDSWLFGTISNWNTERETGFIQAGEKSYYFKKSYCFNSTWDCKPGDRVSFKPLPPLGDTKNERANFIFIEGQVIKGSVINVTSGYSFIEIASSDGVKHNLFVLSGGQNLSAGIDVKVNISNNVKGPIGIDATVITELAEQT
ncbi:hypothetical protein [Ferrimonas pelagia]|uniref:Uncharacterized protein n=1 Tax=Ferrimonas pelagia TaxID=1177826 RepID=A0ABP9ENM9_9GAMM